MAFHEFSDNFRLGHSQGETVGFHDGPVIWLGGLSGCFRGLVGLVGQPGRCSGKFSCNFFLPDLLFCSSVVCYALL